MGFEIFNRQVVAKDVEAKDVIVLTEGFEGEVFPDQIEKIPLPRCKQLEVAFVNCGGFSEVARKYDEFCDAGLEVKLIPTFDQDIVETDKEAGRNAWTSSSKYLFYPSFEEEFPDWVLTEAIRKCDCHFPIPEDIVTQAKQRNRSEEDFYEAVERMGSQLYEGFRMLSKPELTHALRDILVHFYYVTPNISRWLGRIDEVGSRNKQVSVASENVSVNWDVVKHLNFAGVLIYVAQSDGKLWYIDFDKQMWEPIGLTGGTVKPVIRPMWSPDGKMIAFTGKRNSRTVTAVLAMNDNLREYMIDLGDPRRPTALSDWDPREKDSKHLFINGPDKQQGNRYRLWRVYYDGRKAFNRIEPLVGYSCFKTYGRQCIGIGGGGNTVRVLRLIDAHSVEILEDKEINVGQVGAMAWNYDSPNLHFAFVQTTSDGLDNLSTIQLAELDAHNLNIAKYAPLFPSIRFIQDLCWSPDGQYLLFTAKTADPSIDDWCLFAADLRNSGKVYPILNRWVRISNRSWVEHLPEFLTLCLRNQETKSSA